MELKIGKTQNMGHVIIAAMPIAGGRFDYVVVGYRAESKPGMKYVTWLTTDGRDYYWGHYFMDDRTALCDMVARSLGGTLCSVIEATSDDVMRAEH